MSVYLDPMFDWNKVIGRAGPNWCHMIADTEEELHAMAAKVGLRRLWFQAPPKSSMPHYDIGTERIRRLAVACGAIECDRKTFVEHKRWIHQRAVAGEQP